MDKKEVKQLITEAIEQNSETKLVEFKDGRGGLPRDVWKTVSAFGHKPGGGIIAFGVAEEEKGDFVLVGNSNISILQEKFSDLVSNEMSHTLRPDYYILEINSFDILAVYVPECPTQFKPYYYSPVGIPNGAYIRDGNTDRKITNEEMRKFIENARKHKFDMQRAEGTKVEDISKEKIFNLLIETGKRTKRNISLEDINLKLMKNLGIVNEFEEKIAPTIAGFLIFAKDTPQDKRVFSRYLIRCVRYNGSNQATDIIDSRDIGGALDEQIDETQKFILRNIKKSSRIEGTKRVDQYEYPPKAIREIVANAVIHRDYKITETYTQVNIFEDRIEVFNPGCLPPGVTVDNIKDAQVSRNEIIAARLKDLDYLEEYGRGIDIVFNKMRDRDLLDPIFKNSSNSFKVILMGKKLSNLNERQIKIWNYLVDKEKIDINICRDILPEVSRRTLNRDLEAMSDKGLIDKKGRSQNIYYTPAY